MTIPKAKLDEWKRDAEKATPGPWEWEGSIYEHMGAGLRAIPDNRGLGQLWQHANVLADATHIANADPDNFLALIAALEQSQAENEALRKSLRPFATGIDGGHVINPDDPDEKITKVYCTVGDLRQAAKAGRE